MSIHRVAQQISDDISSMREPEEYAKAYVYALLEDHNFHTENRELESKFGPLTNEAYDVAGDVYYDLTPGSSYDFDFNVGHELAMIVAERNYPALADWLDRI